MLEFLFTYSCVYDLFGCVKDPSPARHEDSVWGGDDSTDDDGAQVWGCTE